MSDVSVVPPAGGWSPLPPPPAAAQPAEVVGARPRHRRRAIAAALIAIVVVAGTVGGILGFRLLGGGADNLVAMAPSDTVVYVNAHLDPSAGQKLTLNGLLNKFPSLGGSSRDATINGWIDSLLKSAGLTHTDIRPWLGSDISLIIPSSAVAALTSSSGNGSPDLALLVSSTNDSQAQAAITALRQKSGSSEQWATSTYDGVALQIASGPDSGVFAVTNHALVVGSSTAVMHEVIDTAQGKHAALQTNAAYTTAVGRVPSDHIGLAFVDLGAIVQRLPNGATTLLPQKSLGALQAFRGVAAALVAQSNGLSVNAVEDFDPSKLDADQRAQLGLAGHVNGSIAFMPRSAYAAGTMTDLRNEIKGLLNTFGSGFGFDISSVLDQFGITGPDGIVDHLSGDAGIDLTPESSPDTPGGAVAIGTDSDTAAQRFVDNLVQSLCSGECTPSITTQRDGDATISTLALPLDVTSGVQLSWSVFHSWIIVGSSAAQVKTAVDADRSGATLATNPDYTAVMSQVGGSNNGSLFLDIQPLVSMIRGTLSPSDQTQFDSNIAPNLKPLKAFGLATHNASDHVSINMFTLIP